MEEDAMICTEKLGRMVSRSTKVKKPETKKVSARNPLSDCNMPSIPPLQASAEGQRRGCFRFLRPNFSSKEDSILRSKCQPRTPKSAPPSSRTLSSKAIPNPSSYRNKNRPKPISENPQNIGLKKLAKPNTPDLLDKWNPRNPISRELTRGKITKPEPIVKVNFKAKNGSFVDSTRERAFTPEGIKPCSEVKEGKPHLSATPRSNSTPPIQASISPEVLCVSVAPAPVCFATGHVMAGVQDRRKCRPCGILTIGEEHSNVSRVSSAPPPLAEASVCWFSSPLEIGNRSGRDASCSKVRTYHFSDDTSIKWLVSPSDTLGKEIGTGVEKTKSSVLDAEFEVEKTPSSCTGILRTPTSNSSVSPFSVIVQRAEASSRFQFLNSNKEKGGYRYGNAFDVSPFSEKSWSNSNAVSTPSSYTYSRRNGVISPLELDSAPEDLEAMRLSKKSVPGNNQNDSSTLLSPSFKFGCQPTLTPFSSIDLNRFKSSRCDEFSKIEIPEKNLSASGTRVSWREGLLSRVFEIGGLDSYHCFFDDNEDVDYPRDGDAKSEFGFKVALENGSSAFEKGNGFGSYEFLVDCNKFGAQKCQSKVPPLKPNSFAESFSTESGLISSGDSDWTLFYKNNLFEV